MILPFFILFFVYFLCMMGLVYGCTRVTNFSSENVIPQNRFSVVIPFRNEGENLPELLETIERLDYAATLVEFIFVNDASEDNSEEIVFASSLQSKFSIRIIQNSRITNSPKKDAISQAIKHSNFAWIVTTDADCRLPKQWLQMLDSFIQKNDPVLVCGPVCYSGKKNFIEIFQQLDCLSLQAVTIGSFGLGRPLLCNGANLAYRKEAFLKVEGFSGNDHVASGDDIFLLVKLIKAYPRQVSFLKSKAAIVETKPEKTVKTVIDQRIRWASKTSKVKGAYTLLLGILVFLTNLAILSLPILMCFYPENIWVYVGIIFLKVFTDYIVVRQSAQFFEVAVGFWQFLGQIFFYSAIVVIAATGSLFGQYSWKGRSFEKQ